MHATIGTPQEHKVISISASTPNTAHTSRSITLLDHCRSHLQFQTCSWVHDEHFYASCN